MRDSHYHSTALNIGMVSEAAPLRAAHLLQHYEKEVAIFSGCRAARTAANKLLAIKCNIQRRSSDGAGWPFEIGNTESACVYVTNTDGVEFRGAPPSKNREG